MKRILGGFLVATLAFGSVPAQAGDTANVLGGLLAVGLVGAAINNSMQHQSHNDHHDNHYKPWLCLFNASLSTAVCLPAALCIPAAGRLSTTRGIPAACCLSTARRHLCAAGI